MLCVALKNFLGNGQQIVRDQLVEGDDFRNRDQLIDLRYLRPATTDEVKSAIFEGEDESDEQPTAESSEPEPAPKSKTVVKKPGRTVGRKAKGLKARKFR